MREENLFYKLADKDNENVTSELLCNLCLINSKYKKIILESLCIDNNLVNSEDIDTQKAIPGENKIPDIFIENKNVIILIENKVSRFRKLEISQITVYPKYLTKMRKSKKVKLIFLIPDEYKDEKKIMQTRKKYDFIEIVYWEEVLKKMKKLKSEILEESIYYFEEILDSIPEIEFTTEERKIMRNVNQLAKTIPAIDNQLKYFENVIKELSKLDNIITRGPKEFTEWGLGFYILKEKKEIGFLGYSFKLSKKEYSISLAIRKEKAIRNIKKIKKNEFPYVFDDEYYYFKIDLDWKEEELFKYCEDIMKKLAILKEPPLKIKRKK